MGMKNFFGFLMSLLLIFVVMLFVTFPATWLLMLFLGNLGLGLSYWGTLPLGILVATLIGAAGSSENWTVFTQPTVVGVNEAIDE